MAQKSSNAKELLLTMRAAEGVFPAAGAALEDQVRSLVTAKMMELATLDQLMEYAGQYSVDPARARAYLERMFQLARESSDSRVWYRIKAAAFHLKQGDLERQARARGDELAAR
jgi:hypothetical protein